MGLGRKFRLGVSVGRQMEFSWETYNWTPTQECGRDFGSEKSNGSQLGDLGGDKVINFEWV